LFTLNLETLMFRPPIVVALLSVSLLTIACDRSGEESTAQQPDNSAASTSGAAEGPSNEPFSVATETAESEVSVEVTPTDGFKINTEYPWQLHLKDAPAEAKPSLSRDDAATFDESRARFVIDAAPFVQRRQIAAELRFSVCSDETCLMKTRQLEWDVAGGQ
jgi:hypothetical protein